MEKKLGEIASSVSQASVSSELFCCRIFYRTRISQHILWENWNFLISQVLLMGCMMAEREKVSGHLRQSKCNKMGLSMIWGDSEKPGAQWGRWAGNRAGSQPWRIGGTMNSNALLLGALLVLHAWIILTWIFNKGPLSWERLGQMAWKIKDTEPTQTSPTQNSSRFVIQANICSILLYAWPPSKGSVLLTNLVPRATQIGSKTVSTIPILEMRKPKQLVSVVLHIYRCVRNHLKTLYFKQQPFDYISWFCGSEVW